MIQKYSGYTLNATAPVFFYFLANTLCQHCIGNFFKSCDIGSYHIVSFKTISLCSINHIMSADVATPPAFAAFPGAKITPFS